jgi:hypothetical protein
MRLRRIRLAPTACSLSVPRTKRDCTAQVAKGACCLERRQVPVPFISTWTASAFYCSDPTVGVPSVLQHGQSQLCLSGDPFGGKRSETTARGPRCTTSPIQRAKVDPVPSGRWRGLPSAPLVRCGMRHTGTTPRRRVPMSIKGEHRLMHRDCTPKLQGFFFGGHLSMKALSLLLSLLALVLFAGCAQPNTSELGASSSGGSICRDGYRIPKGAKASCGDHGGFEREY